MNAIKKIVLPDGAYFDDDEMLHAPNGELLPDGVYETREGETFLYEGNFANRFFSLSKD